jgi:hypothetical protein
LIVYQQLQILDTQGAKFEFEKSHELGQAVLTSFQNLVSLRPKEIDNVILADLKVEDDDIKLVFGPGHLHDALPLFLPDHANIFPLDSAIQWHILGPRNRNGFIRVIHHFLIFDRLLHESAQRGLPIFILLEDLLFLFLNFQVGKRIKLLNGVIPRNYCLDFGQIAMVEVNRFVDLLRTKSEGLL